MHHDARMIGPRLLLRMEFPLAPADSGRKQLQKSNDLARQQSAKVNSYGQASPKQDIDSALSHSESPMSPSKTP